MPPISRRQLLGLHARSAVKLPHGVGRAARRLPVGRASIRSSVVALMAEASRARRSKPARSASMCPDLDETANMPATIAERFATHHRERIVSPDDFGLINTLVHAFRRTLRRRVRPADLPRLRTGAGEGDGRALRRWRRRGDGGLPAPPFLRRREPRPLAALPGRFARSVFGHARPQALSQGRLGAASACAPRATFAGARPLARGSLCPRRSASLTPEMRARLFTDTQRWQALGWASCRGSRDHRVMRDAPAEGHGSARAQYADHDDLDARRHPHQGRSHQHGGGAGGA